MFKNIKFRNILLLRRDKCFSLDDTGIHLSKKLTNNLAKPAMCEELLGGKETEDRRQYGGVSQV